MERQVIRLDIGTKRPYELEVTRHELHLRGLPARLHGTKLLQLSDLHLGFGGTEPVFEEAVRRIQEEQPDIILVTGDYVDDHANPRDFPPARGLLQKLCAPLGVFGSLGNHEHRRGVEAARALLRGTNITLLENESTVVEGLHVAALDDWGEGVPDIERAFAAVPPEVTPILMSHNPSALLRLRDRDVVILSGHTHGGQIVLRFPSPKLVCRFHLRCKQVAGWYSDGKAKLYVNRGLGVTGQPWRYNCPAEMTIFTLNPAVD